MKNFDDKKIDDFILERLTPEAYAIFLQQVQEDTELAQVVENRRQEMDFIDLLGDLKMKEKMQAIHEKVKSEQEVKDESLAPVPFRRNLYRWVAAAAAILLLGVFGYQFLTPTPTNNDLFAAHYEAYPINIGSRSQDDVSRQLIEANRFYQNKKYQEALPLFQEALSKTNDSKLKMATGICLLETKQYAKALQAFNSLIENKDPIYEQQATWYAALIHLQENNLAPAKTLLQSLSTIPNAYQQNSAKKLLQQISSKK